MYCTYTCTWFIIQTVRESCNQLRLKGNHAYRCNDLYTAKTFYLQALNQLKKLLQITKTNPDWVNTEYARISANLSLLELTQGHLPEALAAAMESIRMNSTWAKVFQQAYMYCILVGIHVPNSNNVNFQHFLKICEIKFSEISTLSVVLYFYSLN